MTDPALDAAVRLGLPVELVLQRVLARLDRMMGKRPVGPRPGID